jgi:hypothetical protein
MPKLLNIASGVVRTSLATLFACRGGSPLIERFLLDGVGLLSCATGQQPLSVEILLDDPSITSVATVF